MLPYKPFFRNVVLFLGALAFWACPTRLLAVKGGEGLVSTVTESNFADFVLKSKKPVLVDFWATWCGPCRLYGPVVDQVAMDYKGRLKVARVEIDDNPGLARSLRIMAIPSSYLFQNGKLVRRWVGVVSEAQLESGIEEVLKPRETSP